MSASATVTSLIFNYQLVPPAFSSDYIRIPQVFPLLCSFHVTSSRLGSITLFVVPPVSGCLVTAPVHLWPVQYFCCRAFRFRSSLDSSVSSPSSWVIFHILEVSVKSVILRITVSYHIKQAIMLTDFEELNKKSSLHKT